MTGFSTRPAALLILLAFPPACAGLTVAGASGDAGPSATGATVPSGTAPSCGGTVPPPRADAAPPGDGDAGLAEADGGDAIGPSPPANTPIAFDPGVTVFADGACVPYSTVAAIPFVAARDPALRGDVATFSTAMLGDWIGVAAAPAGFVPSRWYVDIVFETGLYLATGYGVSPPPSNPPAFYYGTSDYGPLPSCGPLKEWRLDSVRPDGSALGEIDIPFMYGTSCGLPVWQGELDAIAFDTTGSRMQFAFRTSDGYGPVVYDLWQQCAF